MFLIKLIKESAKRRHLVTIALLFSFVFIKAQDYPITDPRNPQCPCHKYQKLADDEYKKLLRTGNKGNGEFVGRANSRESKIHKTRIEKYRKSKHKIKDKMHRQPRWIYKFKNWDIWKRPNRPIKCPIWNGRS